MTNQPAPRRDLPPSPEQPSREGVRKTDDRTEERWGAHGSEQGEDEGSGQGEGWGAKGADAD
jgi:hypothetical protein